MDESWEFLNRGFESGELPRNCWQGRYNRQCSDSKVKDLRRWLGSQFCHPITPNLEVGDSIFSSTKNNCFWRSICEKKQVWNREVHSGGFFFSFSKHMRSVSMAATSRLNRILLFSSSFFTLCRFLNSCSVFRRCAFTNWSSGLHMTCMTCHETLSAGPPQPEMIGRTLIQNRMRKTK